MDFETRFNELASKPKDEELLQDLITLQEESLKENDADVYLKTSHLLFDTYVNLGDYELATSLFFSILKENRFEAYKTVLDIIDKLVGLLLKTEDFVQLESLLKLRERYLTSNPSQQLMQKFYLAVCQEGQKQYLEAIQTLESITDNISNNNLVSKYLKLSMLYIKIKQYELAKGAFERAKIFDKTMKNEMFYLVASDIAFYQMNYEEALKQFQAFFIKTKVKSRYLDRFIYINIELGKLGEAWHFYKQYLPKIMSSASKNYRMQYYQAGLVLANKVNDIDEVASLHERILGLESKQSEIIDSFDGIKTLLAFASSKIKFKTRREIILETYRVLASLGNFERLLYLFPSMDGLVLYTFKKGLLIEKTFTLQQYHNTILEEIVNQDLSFHLFTKEEVLKQVDYLTNALFIENQYTSILAYKITSLQLTDGYLITFNEKDRQFDYINKLLLTTKSILDEKLSIQKLIDHHETLHRLSERLLSMKGYGLFRIEDGLLFLQNALSKQLIDIENDFIPFEEFQSKIKGPMIYIDDLLRKDHLDIHYQKSQDEILLSIDIWQVEQCIYLLVEDITHEIKNTETLSLLANLTETYPLNTLHALRKNIEAMKESTTLMKFWILGQNRSPLTRQERHKMIEQLRNLIHTSARSHIICLALDEEEGLLLHLSSTDKRVHQRIAKEVVEGMNDYFKLNASVYTDLSVKVGALILQKNMGFSEILNNIDKTKMIESHEFDLVYYDKTMITQESKNQMLFDQFQDFISYRHMPLVFSEIVNLLTKKIEGYETQIDPYFIHGTVGEYQQMIQAYHLEKEHFQLNLQTVINHLVKLETETKHTVKIMIEMPPIILKDIKGVEEIIKRIKRFKLDLGLITFKLNHFNQNKDEIESLRLFKEKGLKIAFQQSIYDAIKLVSIHPSLVDYVLIDYHDYNESTSKLFELFNQARKIQVIMTHIDNAEQLSSLMANKLYQAMGLALTTLTFDELLAKLK